MRNKPNNVICKLSDMNRPFLGAVCSSPKLVLCSDVQHQFITLWISQREMLRQVLQ